MLIICPSCASRYELDAAKLGPAGRKVRCASCQTSWHVEPALEFPEPPSAEETQALLNEELQRAAEIDGEVTAVAAERETPAQQHDETAAPAVAAPRKRAAAGKMRKGGGKAAAQRLRGLAVPLAGALCGLAFLGILTWQRNAAVRVAPQLASVFETLGLPVNVRGLKLSAVESGLVEDGQGRFLVVEGDVTNIARGATPLPPIEVAVKDAGGQTLYTWTTAPPRPTLAPSELVRFRARLASPPEAGTSVRVRFSAGKPTGLAAIR